MASGNYSVESFSYNTYNIKKIRLIQKDFQLHLHSNEGVS